ncbi:hypothetical protein CQ11_03170 [Trueperella pyogenes]|uniref:hypothetical protein n=1 Tax=Trueperella pyogenes TaxID=1661 RepID=UPI00043AD6EA|nr:hypothetical protein [Trueperella pyogenes]AHU90439.1 hypothetical protein CQ11_03170 [Trueperella pyogenes]AWA43096.1 acetyl-CoA carboxylase [Trueperella pyogenes]
MSETPPEDVPLEETVVHPIEVMRPDLTPVEPAQLSDELLDEVAPTAHVLDLTEPILDVLTSPTL